MIKFERYSHVNDLFDFYIDRDGRTEIKAIMKSGVSTEYEAELLARFAWEVAGFINEDEEAGNCVLGSMDNTEMIPDISYELTNYMRKNGFLDVWKKVSDEEMSP